MSNQSTGATVRRAVTVDAPIERPEGSMAIFTAREAAEEFVRDDPFVLNGVVRAWHIREWNEIFTE